MSRAGTVVILAAGQGTRMKSDRPKVLHPACGRPLLAWVLDQALGLDPERILLVVGHGAAEVEAWAAAQGLGERLQCVVQEPQLGTGHALLECRAALGAEPGRVCVLYGDMPLLSAESLQRLCAAQAAAGERGAALLTAVVDEPRGFGRILRGPGDPGPFAAIVEERDASPAERAVPEVNLGVYAFGGSALLETLPRLTNDNAQGEYYLTDIVGQLVREGGTVSTVEIEDLDETIGINNLRHLSEARRALQERILEEHLTCGVYIEDPASTYIDHGVTIGAGTHVLPCTVIRAGVTIGSGCEVGPFTHLRAGTVLEDGAEVGNFTECKQSRMGSGAKAKHLSYLGDATIGAGANIGAGTIFANYDGRAKHPTSVGEKAFVGSGTIVVAPNSLGARSRTGAGAVVTRGAQVGEGETWVGVPARPLVAKSVPPAGTPDEADPQEETGIDTDTEIETQAEGTELP